MDARQEAAVEHQRRVAAAHAKREQQEASRTPTSSESLTHGAPRHSSRQQGERGGRRQAPAPANMSSVSLGVKSMPVGVLCLLVCLLVVCLW